MSRDYTEFFCPVKSISGFKALEHIPYELQSFGAKRPLIVSDQGVEGAGLLEPVKHALKGGGVEWGGVFTQVPPDSSLSVVKEISSLYRELECDALLAIGGGSVIDTCKGVNILVSEGGDDLKAYVGSGALTRKLKPLFVVPTTAGTGSEVTLVAVVRDDESGHKLPIASHFLLPDVAILDPRMTLTLPASITAATAMDALTHSIEAYLSTAKNKLSDAYAFAAIKDIALCLPKVMDNPKDKASRLALAEAATMAGIAFSNAMVGLVHSIGHALGGICHLPHGVCMSLMLPYVLEYNLEQNREMIGELLLPLAGPEVYARTHENERGDRVIACLKDLRDMLHDKAGLPRTLEETESVSRSQLADIAKLAIDDGSLIFNRSEADYEDVLALLNSAWS